MNYSGKYCGTKASSVVSLVSNPCSRHPNGPGKGKHALYEGGESQIHLQALRRQQCQPCQFGRKPLFTASPRPKQRPARANTVKHGFAAAGGKARGRNQGVERRRSEPDRVARRLSDQRLWTRKSPADGVVHQDILIQFLPTQGQTVQA